MPEAFERALNNPIAREVAKAAASAALEAAHQPNEMSPNAVAAARPEIEIQMLEEIARKPELQHVTNTEKWWQKRTRWAFILGSASTVLQTAEGLTGNPDLNFLTPETQALILDMVSAGLAGVAALLALWAGLAKLPLFSRWVGPGA